MRVLVTGGAGFIGRHVHRELVGAGHTVRVLDSLRPDVHPVPAQPLTEPGELMVADVRDATAVESALDGVDVVCHLAAKVGLGVDVQDLPDYADSNVHGTAVVLAAMARAGVGRFVQASSMVVYGEGRGQCPEHGAVRPAPRAEGDLRRGLFEPPCPVCGRSLAATLVAEDCPADPRNAYAASKVGQEHLAADWARLTGGSATSLRFHNVYGPGLPRNTPYAGVAALFLSSLRSGASPQVFEDGGQRRDFVHVRDVAAATRAALGHDSGAVVALNVGSGEPRTVGELASALAAATGGPPPQTTGRYRLGDVRHITADSSAARRLLAWRPRVPFVEGVAELAV